MAICATCNRKTPCEYYRIPCYPLARLEDELSDIRALLRQVRDLGKQIVAMQLTGHPSDCACGYHL